MAEAAISSLIDRNGNEPLETIMYY
jgi:hypothetical protein